MGGGKATPPASAAVSVFDVVVERANRPGGEEGDALATPLLPGLSVPLSEIFA